MLDKGPKNWSTLLEQTELTDAGLFKHLKELRESKFVSKTSRGLYEVTEEGRLALEKARLREAIDGIEDIMVAKAILEYIPVLLNNSR